MYKILIVDAIKASLVMSSEILKDYCPAASILVASSGSQALQILSHTTPDMCLIDFDLPDSDGPSLILTIRDFYKGPILMTAYPDSIVEEVAQKELFLYSDVSSWIHKPIKAEEVIDKIDYYLFKQRRFLKRFASDLDALVISKAEGRGKRAPKVNGQIINISIGGACMHVPNNFKMKKNTEVMLHMPLPTIEEKLYHKLFDVLKNNLPTQTNNKKIPKKLKYVDTKIKSKIAWYNKSQIGLQFLKLNEQQRQSLTYYLKFEAGNEIP